MKKNILNLYEGFFDDLDKLNPNQDDGFRGTNDQVYNKHNYILSPDKNPEFFYGLCDMCEYYQIPYNQNGFLQEDLDKITLLKANIHSEFSYFKDIISLDELQYFYNLEKIYFNSFGNCFKLESIKFPKNLKIISSWAFDKCLSLEKVIFPKNIEKIEDDAFGYCSSLKEIIIPEKFKDSIEYIFYNV